jgi:hypothetical protein
MPTVLRTIYFNLRLIRHLSVFSAGRCVRTSAGVENILDIIRAAGAHHQSSILIGQSGYRIPMVPLRNATSEPLLRVRQCRACNAIFYVCRSCDRGQRYCRQECRASARRQQLRAANRRYQCGPAGRQAHQRRQQQYRLRCAGTSVTDQGSRSITTSNLTGAVKSGHCSVSACISRWVDPFPAIPQSLAPQRRRRRVGERSKNYVFR